MWTMISLAGERRTLRMPSSRLSRMAASSKRAAAAAHGFFSFFSEIATGCVSVATGCLPTHYKGVRGVGRALAAHHLDRFLDHRVALGFYFVALLHAEGLVVNLGLQA